MKKNIYLFLSLLLFSGVIYADAIGHASSAITVSSPISDKNDKSGQKVKALRLKDGSSYIGEVKGKRPHGKGKQIFPNGDIYEGDFVKGKMQGKGKYRFNDGETYEGDFLDGRQHGKGICHFVDGGEIFFLGDSANVLDAAGHIHLSGKDLDIVHK